MDLKASLIAAAALFVAAGAAHASTNVALLSDGASFVSDSSEIGVGDPTIMRIDPISTPPAPAWYYDGDNGFIFGGYDPDQTYTIDLGKDYTLSSFGASFTPSDRPVSGPFTVLTSTNGVTFTPVGTDPLVAGSSGGQSLVLGDVVARYIEYQFGPASTEYGGFGGSRVTEVFANAVPEPATWASMMLGFFGVGAVLRSRRKIAEAAAVA